MGMATVIFDQIKDYSYMHASDAIVDTVINAIALDLPGIGDYLDSRLKDGLYFRSNSQRPIKPAVLTASPDGSEYAAINADCWARESAIQKAVYEETEGSYRPMELVYFDLPFLHLHTEEGMDFLDALKDNKNKATFARPSVQTLVDKQWERWRWFNVRFNVAPMTLQLILFWFWSNVLLPNVDDPDLDMVFNVSEISILMFSLYLIGIELSELYISGLRSYLQNTQQLIEVGATIFVLFQISRKNRFKWETEEGEKVQMDVTFWRMQAWSALFIWFSYLIKLKSLKRYSYLVRMI